MAQEEKYEDGRNPLLLFFSYFDFRPSEDIHTFEVEGGTRYCNNKNEFPGKTFRPQKIVTYRIIQMINFLSVYITIYNVYS